MFMSINTHLSKRPCPTDDIESMFYSLLYLSEKGFPWEKLESPPANQKNKTLELKKIVTIIPGAVKIMNF